MVYISSSALTASMRSSILSAQNDLANAQKELASGIHADLGLTLGASSGQLVELSQQQSRLGAYTAINAVATTRLSTTATTLTAVQSAATSFLASLTTAASSGATTSGLQETAAGNLKALIGQLNTTVAGQAIFAGINSAAAPIASYAPGSASKQAVDAAFANAFGTSQTSSAAGAVTSAQMASFLDGPFASLYDPASYAANWSTASDQALSTEVAPGQTVTTSVSANDAALRGLAQAYTMVSEFTGPTISASAQQAVVAKAVAVATKALAGLTDTQASVGIARSTVSQASDSVAAQTSLLTTQSGSMTDVDIYALNTRISSLQTSITASYELTSELKKLSLTNYFSA